MRGVLTNVSKKLIGDGAELFLPFALSRLRYFATTWTGAQQSHIIKTGDGVMILLELFAEDKGKVTIFAGSPSYEFTTTGDSLNKGITYWGAQVYRAYAVNGSYNKGAGAVTGKLNGNTVRPKDGVYPDPLSMDKKTRHKTTWQIQCVNEHVFYPNAEPFPYLMDSWSQTSELANLNNLGGYPNYLFYDIDVGYDLPPTLFTGEAVLDGTWLVPDADFYKRAAMRVVTHPTYGSRTFIILSDITNKFYAYPTSVVDPSLAQYSPSAYVDLQIKTTVPGYVTKNVQAPLPVWVWQGVGQARDNFTTDNEKQIYIYKFPQYRWAFNSKATRAAAICYELLPAVRTVADEPLTRTVAGYTFDLQEGLPGIVELNLAINIIGPNPEDFTFDVTLESGDAPSTKEEFPMAVDYAWKIEGMTELDDLVCLDLAVYFDDTRTGGFTGDHGGFNRRDVVSLLNRTKNTTIKELCHTTIPYSGFTSYNTDQPYREVSSIACYELRTLSFVIQREVVAYTYPVGDFNKREQVAMMLETIAWGKTIEDDVGSGSKGKLYMSGDAALDAILDAAHGPADLSTENGWVKYSPNWLETPDGIPGHYATRVAGSSAIYYDGLLPEGWTEMPIGAITYMFSADNAMKMGLFEWFTVHPEGHWAVATLPTFYYGGQYEEGYPRHAGLEKVADWLKLSDMKQDFVDIVNYNIKKKDGTYKSVRTTHVKLYNQAVGKASTTSGSLTYLGNGEQVSKEDLMYKFTYEEIVFQNPASYVYLKFPYIVITPPFEGMTTGYFNWAILSNVQFVTDDYYVLEWYPLSNLTNHSNDFLMTDGPVFENPDYANITYPPPAGPLMRADPVVLHGSGLFSCNLNKLPKATP